MWGGGAGRTGQVTDRLGDQGGLQAGWDAGADSLNAEAPTPGQAKLLCFRGRQANPWPRSLLGHPGGGKKKGKGFRERVPAESHVVCGGGEESGQGSSLPAPAYRLLTVLGSLPPGCPVASALGHGLPLVREPSLRCPVSPWPSHLLVTPPRGWVVCRDHLGRRAHNLLLRHPPPSLAPTCHGLPAPLRQALHLGSFGPAELCGRPGQQIFEDCIVIADWANRARL